MKTPTHSSALDIETIGLSNGSTLYFKKMKTAPRVALSVYMHGGNRLEPVSGLADMIDNLLCEGTERRTAEQIAIEMDGLSLDMDTETRRDYSVMGTTFLDEDFEASMDMLSDMLYHSTLAEFDKEKIRLHGELVMDLDSPRHRSHDLLMTEMFKHSPYKASHSKILEALPGITSVGPLKQHYETVYQPQNAIFSVVGNVEADLVQRYLEQYFVRGSGQNLSDAQAPTIPPLTESKYLTYAKDDSNQLHIYKGWFAPQLSHPDYPAMVVLNTILGGAGLTSRLFIELRDKQGLAYMVRSQYESSKYTGLFYLYIGTEPNNRQKALKGFEVECQKLIDQPVGHQELEEAKENILGRRVVFMETAAQQAAYIGNQLALGVSVADLDAITERIQAVSAMEVQAVAQKYLTQPSVITAVGPSKHL